MVPQIVPDGAQDLFTKHVLSICQALGTVHGGVAISGLAKRILLGPQSICRRTVIRFLGGFTLAG